MEESRALWQELVRRNPENYVYFRGLECCALDLFDRYDSFAHIALPSSSLSLSFSQREILLALYRHLAEAYPKSNAIQYIQLYLLEGDAFNDLCSAMTERAVRKGIPSFFNTLETVFDRSPEKVPIFATRHV